VVAGLVGTVAGLASLVSYPALLAAGLGPVPANVTNTVALLGNAAGGLNASRPELAGQGDRLRRLALPTALGGAAGGALLLLTPPGALSLQGADRPGGGYLPFTRQRLAHVLEENGFLRHLDASIDEVVEEARITDAAISDVLLVGGSTLLPGVFPLLERRFERRRLRAWQPFEAVAYGGACFAAGRVAAVDFIVHDYAFVTHDARTGQTQHVVVVPRGTRFPTKPDFWKRQLVPTCSLGMEETTFKLLICEVSRGDALDRRFVWDAAGDLHKLGGTSGEGHVVVPLNEAAPTLGYLDPPHSPRDRRPRLEMTSVVQGPRIDGGKSELPDERCHCRLRRRVVARHEDRAATTLV